jgi:argininosuccinate lyase
MKMWSGRFRERQDAAFERWQRSFPFDRRLLPEEVAASRAYARALHGAGVLSAQELEDILRGLEHILREHGAEAQDEGAEDVHDFAEARLTELIGPAASKLHTGRSRNEQIATDLRLFTRAACDHLAEDLAELVSALLDRAQEAGGAAMPAYTHLQRAEPVLVSHWLLAYAHMLLRDMERLEECRARLNLCPLGSGAVAGATVPLDRVRLAADLGFDGPTANSMDATSDRDFAIEFVQVLSLLAVHLSRWAEEMILFSTAEFGYVRLPEAFSTGSSAMPQKKNPDALELLRGKAGRIVGAATALLVTVKGLPLAYNKDLQETQEPLFDAAESASGMLQVATGFLRAVEFDLAAMQARAASGFTNAMAAASYLAGKGVPFRQAHEQVGRAVRLCLERGCDLADLPLRELQQLGPGFDEGFHAALKLPAVLAAHDVPGGTAPQQVRAALQEARQRLEARSEAQHARA